MPLILEGIVTTVNADESFNVAPMGPIVDRAVTQLTLRPFPTSTTNANLRRTGKGIFHVVDDVELIAKAAIGRLEPLPNIIQHPQGDGGILADSCHWYAFEVNEIDDSQERVRMECVVRDTGLRRPFFGLNRAKHAVIEAAILATRIGILPAASIQAELERLAVLVQKTAGDQEQRAWDLLVAYVRDKTT